MVYFQPKTPDLMFVLHDGKDIMVLCCRNRSSILSTLESISMEWAAEQDVASQGCDAEENTAVKEPPYNNC